MLREADIHVVLSHGARLTSHVEPDAAGCGVISYVSKA